MMKQKLQLIAIPRNKMSIFKCTLRELATIFGVKSLRFGLFGKQQLQGFEVSLGPLSSQNAVRRQKNSERPSVSPNAAPSGQRPL
jgi:hypothetical protein